MIVKNFSSAGRPTIENRQPMPDRLGDLVPCSAPGLLSRGTIREKGEGLPLEAQRPPPEEGAFEEVSLLGGSDPSSGWRGFVHHAGYCGGLALIVTGLPSRRPM